jgi:hypothetical protein
VADPVAVVIPARPTEPFLLEAVDSALRQPEVDELVVATHLDGSPSAQLITEHPDSRVRLVISSGPSAGENLDAGLARTTAKWLAFLDADDCWPAGRVAIGLRAVDAAPGTELVLGRQRAMTADSQLLSAAAPAPLLGAVLISRAAADRIGPFGADIIAQMRWLLRARELGVPTVEVADVVLHRRGHADNLTRTQRPELHRAYLALARERAALQQGAHDG